MLTTPSIAEVIDGIQISLARDIMPEVKSANAQTCVVMIQALLQTIAQRVPVEQQLMAAEMNEMTATLREVAGLVGSSRGSAAASIRSRAKTLGGRDDVPPVPSYDEVNAAHRELSQAIVDTLADVDVLLRAGNKKAEGALARLRQHIAPRTLQEFGVYTIGAGMAGRG
ncbi:MAG: hypothetical protein ABI782_00770 [Anaerolineaceae bacterium]